MPLPAPAPRSRGGGARNLLPSVLPDRRIQLNTKINNIQFLRAFAAIAVAVSHTGFILPYLKSVGTFGVDVFFVISGYVMARICETDSRFFFRRRVLRIVPPYWVATILLFIFTSFFPYLLKATRAVPSELIKSLFFIPFAKSNGVMQPLLFVGWSLNYEMFFYVVLGISLLIYRRRAVWLAGAAIVLTIVISRELADHSVVARFFARDISAEFVLGLISYYLCRAVPERLAARMRLPMLVLLIASMLGLVLFEGLATHVDARFLTFGSLSFLLISSGALLSRGGWDTNATAAVLVGDASYILYLIHPYCEFFASRVLGRYVPWLNIASAPGMLVTVTLVAFVAIALHVKLERPTIAFLNKNFGGTRKSAEFAAAKWTAREA
jgi:exopolysaccharide production protein ExoZ